MGLFGYFSVISRKRKLETFCKFINQENTTKVLDVGGEIKNTSQLLELFPKKKDISVINISKKDIETISSAYPEVDARVGDACNLPWPDDYFDIIYSNAVIEHLGSFEKQKKMASEIMRVGRKWFVTTPNRWYPYEFHMRLPFVTWLPFHGYLWAGKIIAYSHDRKKYVTGIRRNDLRLLTATELQVCFPGSQIIKQRVTFMPETLIAIGQKSG